ncbi:MAG: AAA family ATPase, partial [Catenulispora sp.]|nr:AAA family ATPase [Catenulispora sp.]
MRLLRIRLTNFRGVADRELTFAEQGVTVVEGPNESGKSSTIEAFGLLLDELDSSKKEAVRAVKPRHTDASPEVEAEFRVGGHHLVYRKRWLRPLTELRVLAPTPQTLTGREAHEHVLAILQQATDYDLFKALRVLQDKPFDVDRIAGSTSLRAALDAAAGGAGPSDGAEDTLMERVEKEFARYYTPKNHQPTGEYRAAQEAYSAAVQDADELAEILARVEADAERHGAVSARLAELQRRLVSDRGEAEEFRRQAATVQTLRTRRDEAATQVERAERDAQLASNAWEARRELVQRVSQHAGELAKVRADIAAQSELRATADARRDSALAMHQAADEANRLAQRRYQEADADYRWKRDEHELARIAADRRALEEADRDVAAAQTEQAATEIDDRLVDKIELADRAVRDARTALEVTAATVRVERLGAAAVTVAAPAVPGARAEQADSPVPATGAAGAAVGAEALAAENTSPGGATAARGAHADLADSPSPSPFLVPVAVAVAVPSSEPVVRRITDPLVIEAEGILRVTLAPGASERELRAQLDDAESSLATLCQQAGVRDLASARIRLQRHGEARASLRAAETARDKLSKDPCALADEQARLEARIADHLERREPGTLPPADRHEAETVAEHRRTESEETAAHLALAASALRSAEEETSRLAAEAENLRGRADSLVAEHEAARARLADARAAASDDAVESRDAEAVKALATAVQDRAVH